MLRPNADADQAGGQAAQKRRAGEEADHEGRRQRLGAAEDLRDDAVLDEQLEALGQPRRQLPPALHGVQMLSRGWHSGAVFGTHAAAAAVGKLLGLDAARFEDALGLAGTQSAGQIGRAHV